MDAETPFTVAGLDHLLLLVNDMETAIAFYQGVIGCRVTSRLPQYGMAELSAGASNIALVDWTVSEGSWAKPANDGGRNIDHFCLSLGTGEEAALRAHLSRHGVAVIEEQVEDERLSLYVQDPSGNTVELRLPA